MKKENIDLEFEESMKKIAEEEGKELIRKEFNGNIYYTIGSPDIRRLVETALRLTE